MNWKNFLIVVLVLTALGELGLSLGGFLAPAFLLTQFRLSVNADTLFLAFVLAWMLLVPTAASALAARQVACDERAGWSMSVVLGVWWIAIGVALTVFYSRPEHLIGDTLKGVLIVLGAIKSWPEGTQARRQEAKA